MASSYSGSNNSIKLKNTLSELESALADWDKIPVSNDGQTNTDSDTDAGTGPQGANRKTAPGPEIPDEMKRRTKELLDRLKQQIDDL